LKEQKSGQSEEDSEGSVTSSPVKSFSSVEEQFERVHALRQEVEAHQGQVLLWVHPLFTEEFFNNPQRFVQPYWLHARAIEMVRGPVLRKHQRFMKQLLGFVKTYGGPVFVLVGTSMVPQVEEFFERHQLSGIYVKTAHADPTPLPVHSWEMDGEEDTWAGLRRFFREDLGVRSVVVIGEVHENGGGCVVDAQQELKEINAELHPWLTFPEGVEMHFRQRVKTYITAVKQFLTDTRSGKAVAEPAKTAASVEEEVSNMRASTRSSPVVQRKTDGLPRQNQGGRVLPRQEKNFINSSPVKQLQEQKDLLVLRDQLIREIDDVIVLKEKLPQSVTSYGGNEVKPDSLEYMMGVFFGQALFEAGLTPCTGGGLGLMHAILSGYLKARGPLSQEETFFLRLALDRIKEMPPEMTRKIFTQKTQGFKLYIKGQPMNDAVEVHRYYTHFVPRKMSLLRNALVVNVGVGGFGTKDEFDESLRSGVLVFANEFWKPVIDSMREQWGFYGWRESHMPEIRYYPSTSKLPRLVQQEYQRAIYEDHDNEAAKEIINTYLLQVARSVVRHMSEALREGPQENGEIPFTVEALHQTKAEIIRTLPVLNTWPRAVVIIGSRRLHDGNPLHKHDLDMARAAARYAVNMNIPIRVVGSGPLAKVVVEEIMRIDDPAWREQYLKTRLQGIFYTGHSKMNRRAVTSRFAAENVIQTSDPYVLKLLLTEKVLGHLVLPGRLGTFDVLSEIAVFHHVQYLQSGQLYPKPLALVGAAFWQPYKDILMETMKPYVLPDSDRILQVIDMEQQVINVMEDIKFQMEKAERAERNGQDASPSPEDSQSFSSPVNAQNGYEKSRHALMTGIAAETHDGKRLMVVANRRGIFVIREQDHGELVYHILTRYDEAALEEDRIGQNRFDVRDRKLTLGAGGGYDLSIGDPENTYSLYRGWGLGTLLMYFMMKTAVRRSVEEVRIYFPRTRVYRHFGEFLEGYQPKVGPYVHTRDIRADVIEEAFRRTQERFGFESSSSPVTGRDARTPPVSLPEPFRAQAAVSGLVGGGLFVGMYTGLFPPVNYKGIEQGLEILNPLEQRRFSLFHRKNAGVKKGALVSSPIHILVIPEGFLWHLGRVSSGEAVLRDTVQGLLKKYNRRYQDTRAHGERVAQYALLMAQEWVRQAGLDASAAAQFLLEIYLAALLHDIGKTRISHKIVNGNGRLQEREAIRIRTHVSKGVAILKKHLDMKRYKVLFDGVRYHQERWDGTGYPYGLQGGEIPVAAAILSLADAFDAITSDRSYRKKAGEIDSVVAHLQEGRGVQFDPQQVDNFMSIYTAGKMSAVLQGRPSRAVARILAGIIEQKRKETSVEASSPVKEREQPSELFHLSPATITLDTRALASLRVVSEGHKAVMRDCPVVPSRVLAVREMIPLTLVFPNIEAEEENKEIIFVAMKKILNQAVLFIQFLLAFITQFLKQLFISIRRSVQRPSVYKPIHNVRSQEASLRLIEDVPSFGASRRPVGASTVMSSSPVSGEEYAVYLQGRKDAHEKENVGALTVMSSSPVSLEEYAAYLQGQGKTDANVGATTVMSSSPVSFEEHPVFRRPDNPLTVPEDVVSPLPFVPGVTPFWAPLLFGARPVSHWERGITETAVLRQAGEPLDREDRVYSSLSSPVSRANKEKHNNGGSWRKDFSYNFISRSVRELKQYKKEDRVRNGVAIFGSARKPSERAETLAKMLASKGHSIITGGGPGVMESANRGAALAGGDSVGLTIQLPFEDSGNPYVNRGLKFKYFFSRLVTFVKLAQSGIFEYGGFGTLNELMTVLALKQRGFLDKDTPHILLPFWQPVLNLLDQAYAEGYLATPSANLVRLESDAHTIQDIIDEHDRNNNGHVNFNIDINLVRREMYRVMRALMLVRGPIVSIVGSHSQVDPELRDTAREISRRLASQGVSLIVPSLSGVGEAVREGYRQAQTDYRGLYFMAKFIPMRGYDQDADGNADMDLGLTQQFIRKTFITSYSDMILGFPGGLGTLDTLMEALTLAQTGKLKNLSVIPVGKAYWKSWERMFSHHLADYGMISEQDIHRFRSVNTPDAIEARIRHIYQRKSSGSSPVAEKAENSSSPITSRDPETSSRQPEESGLMSWLSRLAVARTFARIFAGKIRLGQRNIADKQSSGWQHIGQDSKARMKYRRDIEQFFRKELGPSALSARFQDPIYFKAQLDEFMRKHSASSWLDLTYRGILLTQLYNRYLQMAGRGDIKERFVSDLVVILDLAANLQKALQEQVRPDLAKVGLERLYTDKITLISTPRLVYPMVYMKGNILGVNIERYLEDQARAETISALRFAVFYSLIYHQQVTDEDSLAKKEESTRSQIADKFIQGFVFDRSIVREADQSKMAWVLARVVALWGADALSDDKNMREAGIKRRMLIVKDRPGMSDGLVLEIAAHAAVAEVTGYPMDDETLAAMI
ncbi:MAG: LOG family protein, partial [Candidatus Omnitrophota bacterium]